MVYNSWNDPDPNGELIQYYGKPKYVPDFVYKWLFENKVSNSFLLMPYRILYHLGLLPHPSAWPFAHGKNPKEIYYQLLERHMEERKGAAENLHTSNLMGNNEN